MVEGEDEADDECVVGDGGDGGNWEREEVGYQGLQLGVHEFASSF